MATPRIQLEVITDFLIKAGKINDKALVAKIKESLKSIKIPEIDISAIVDVGNPQRMRAGFDQIRSSLDGIYKNAEEVGKAVNKAFGLPEVRTNAQGELTEEWKKAWQGISDEQRKAFSGIQDNVKRQTSSLAQTFQNALRLEDTLGFGKDGERAAKLLDEVLNKGRSINSLTKEDQKLARQGFDDLKKRLTLIKSVQRESEKLFRNVGVITEVEGKDGAVFDTKKRVPGSAVFLEDITQGVKNLEKTVARLDKLLDPDKAARVADITKGLEDRFDGRKSDSLSRKIKDVQKELGNLVANPKAADQIRDGLNSAEEGAKQLKNELKEIKKLEDYDPDKESRLKDVQNREKKHAEDIHKLKSRLTEQLDRQQQLGIDRQVVKAGEYARVPLRAARADAASEVFKKAERPDLEIQKIRNPIDAGNAVEYFRRELARAGDELTRYNRESSKSDPGKFSQGLQDRISVLERYRSLLGQAVDQEKQARDALTPKGQERLRKAEAAEQKRFDKDATASLKELAKERKAIDDEQRNRAKDYDAALDKREKKREQYQQNFETAEKERAKAEKERFEDYDKALRQRADQEKAAGTLAAQTAREIAGYEKAQADELARQYAEADKILKKRQAAAEGLPSLYNKANKAAISSQIAATNLTTAMEGFRDKVDPKAFDSLSKKLDENKKGFRELGDEIDKAFDGEKFTGTQEALDRINERGDRLSEQYQKLKLEQAELRGEARAAGVERDLRPGEYDERRAAEGERILADRARAERIGLDREGRVPGAALAAAIGAGQAISADQQLAIGSALEKRLSSNLAEQKRVENLLSDGNEQAARDSKTLHEDIKKGFETLGARPEVAAEGDVRDRVAQAAREDTKAARAFDAAQKEYARKEYGIDLDDTRAMKEFVDLSKERLTGEKKRIEGDMDRLAKGGKQATQEYRDLNKQLTATQQELRGLEPLSKQVNEQLKSIAYASNPEQLAKLKASRKILAGEIIDRSGGEKGLARTLSGVSKADRAFLPLVRDELKERQATAQGQADRLRAEGKSSSDEFRKAANSADTLGKAVGRVNTQLKGYFTLSSQIGGLFRQFARYGIGYAALYQLLFAFRALVGGVVELDTALISIKAVTQATNKEMGIIERSIKSVALTTQFTTGEIAKAAQVLAQAGVEAKEFPTALTAVSAFASATESSIEVSADLISSMRNVFKDMDDLAIANQLTQAVNISKLTAEDLKTIISLSAQMANTYSVAAEQYLSAVSTLRNAGIKASTVATGLRQSLIEIFSPDSKTIGVLKQRYAQLGEDTRSENIQQKFFSFSQAEDPLLEVLRELKRIGFTGAGKATFAGRTFDVRAENAINGLINNLDEYVQNQAQVVFGNAAIKGSITQMESLSNSAKNLGAAIVSTTHDLSMDLLPGIEDFIDGMTEVVQGLSEFDSALRVSAGTSAFDTLPGGAVAAAVTAGSVPKGTGLLKGGAIGAGALLGGTYLSGQVQKFAGEKLGVGDNIAKLLGDLSGVLTGLVAATVLTLTNTTKKVARSTFDYSGSSKNSGFKNKIAKAFSGGAAGIGKIFSGAARAIGRVLTFGLSGPLGWIVGIATSAYTLFNLFNRYSSDGKDLERRVKQAHKEFEQAAAEDELLKKKVSQLTPSDPATGYRAPVGTIARSAEDVEDSVEEYDRQLAAFMDAADGVIDASAEEVTEILRSLNDIGYEAGSGANKQLLERLRAIGLDAVNNPEIKDRLGPLLRSLSDIDNGTTGFVKGLARQYEDGLSKIDEIRDSTDEADIQLVALVDSVKELGLSDELLIQGELTTQQLIELVFTWMDLFRDMAEKLGLLTKSAEAVAENIGKEVKGIISRSKQLEGTKLDEFSRLNIRPAETDAQVTRLREIVDQGTEAALDEAERVQTPRTVYTEGKRTEVIDGKTFVFRGDRELGSSSNTDLKAQESTNRVVDDALAALEETKRRAEKEAVDLAEKFAAKLYDIPVLEENAAQGEQVAKAYVTGFEKAIERNAQATSKVEELAAGHAKAKKALDDYNAAGAVSTEQQAELTNEVKRTEAELERARLKVPKLSDQERAFKFYRDNNLNADNILPFARKSYTVDTAPVDAGTGLPKVLFKPGGDETLAKGFEGLTTAAAGKAQISASNLELEEDLTFESTEAYRRLSNALDRAAEEVDKFSKQKNYDDLQAALVKRRDSELALAQENLRFIIDKGPKDGKYSSEVAHQKEKDKIYKQIRAIERKFLNDELRFRQQQLRQEVARSKSDINAFKKLAQDKAEGPYFSAFGDILGKEEEFQAAVERQIAAVTELLEKGNEDPEVIKRRVDAIKAEHRTLIEFANVIEKATKATEAYNEALAKINAADAVGRAGNVGLEVIKRDYDINASPEDRKAAVVQEATAQKKALDANLKAYQIVAAELTNAQLAGAPDQVIADLTEKLALMEDQLQDNVDRMAELRSLARGINLDILGELNKGFSPQGILSDFRRQTEEEVSSLGDTIRSGFEDAFDGVSDVITDAVFGDLEGDFLENLDNIVRDVFKQMAKDIVKTAVKTALLSSLEAVVPQQFQKFINPQQQAAGNAVVTPSQAAASVVPALTAPVQAAGVFGGAQSPLFPDATGIPALTGPAALFSGATGGTCPIDDSCFKSMFDSFSFGTDTPAAAALATGQTSPFSDIGALPDVAADLPVDEVAEAQEGFFDKFVNGFKSFFGSIGDTLSSAFDALKSGFGSIASGAGDLLSGVLGIFGFGGTAMTGATFSSSGAVQKPLRRAEGGLLDRLRGRDKNSAVQRNFESEKSEQRKMLGDALEDKLKEEGILKRGMGGMMRLVRRSRGGPMDIPLGQAIRGAHGKGGIIKGPGTGTSDSIPGVIVDSSGRPQRGILVSNEEAILNAKATAKLGKPTIDWLNTNADKLASGGMVNAGLRKVHEATQSVVGGSRRIMSQERERGMDMMQVQEAMRATLATQEPAKMKLEVSDSALNRTLRDYIEGYLRDEVALR